MFTFKRVKPVVKNGKEAQEIIDRLEGFLTQESPKLVYWLGQLFEEQQNAVTYAELREAMLNGFEQQIWKWQEDYAKFVNEKLSPVWIAALQAGAAQLQSRFNEFILDDSDINVKDWLRLHTGEFITNIGEDTRAAIKALLAHGQDAGWTAQQMAKAVRPCIGLTRPDALANTRYRQHVYDTLLRQNPGMNPQTAEKQAHEAALKYAAKQHRARAEMIANTELAFAYNRGYHEGVRQAMAQGLMGACEKVWRTAGTNRVCDKCLALNGTRIGFDDPFKIGGKELYRGMHETPPAHPRCRCVVQYVEYLPPARRIPQNAPTIENQFKTQGYVGLSAEESDRFMNQHHNEILLRNNRKINDGKGEESGHCVNAGLNARLRDGNIIESDKKIIAELDAAIQANSLPQKMTLYRGVPYNAIPQLNTAGKTLEQIVNEINALKGTVIANGDYVQVSASSLKNYFNFADISMQIIADKGTPAYISNYLAESEIVLGRDTKLEILSADIVEGLKDTFGVDVGKRVTVILKVVN